MTVSATTNKQRTAGNGATTAFPATIKIFAETDIKVTTINNTTDVLVNTLILNDAGALGFTVTFDTDAETLTVTTNTAPTSAEDIQTLRVLPQTQTTDFPRATKFPALLNENALDKNTMILQDQQEVINRALVLPEESSLINPSLPEPDAGKALLWNAGATDLENSTDDFNDIVTDATTQAVAAAASAAAAAADVVSTNADLVATNQDTIDTAADLVATNQDTIDTAADLVATNQDTIDTAADVVLTGLDVVSTAADVVSTGNDVTSTNADVVTTNADVVLTGLDVASTNADVLTTNADVVLTGLDVASTNADVVTTNADVVLTGLDVASTNADVVTTNADVVLTGIDAAAASDAAGVIASNWLFDTSTSMADPGTGDIRLNNATVASVTQIAISSLTNETGNPDVSDTIVTWDDSTNTNRGTITIRKSGTPATFAVFTINGAITDNGTWLQIPVLHEDSNGALSGSDVLYAAFARAGDAGTGFTAVDITGQADDTITAADEIVWADATGANDLTGAAFSNREFSVNAQAVTPVDIYWKDDGLTMYVVDFTTATIYQYTVSDPFKVDTALYASKSLDVSNEEATPAGMWISPDGTKAYVVGTTNNTVYQYTLGTAFDLSTGSFASKSLDASSQDVLINGMHMSPDGTKVFLIGSTNDKAYQYTIGTPFDISTGSYANKFMSVDSQDTSPVGITMSNDGFTAFILGNNNDTVYQYTIGTAFDLATGSFASKSFSVTAEDTSPQDIFMKFDGSILYMAGNTNNKIFQYALGSGLKKDTVAGILDLYAGFTATLTNKTLDADGTGNVLTNIDIGNAIAASQAEAEAGTDNTKLVTSLRVAEAIAALGGAGGAIDIQTFTGSGTWTKPGSGTWAFVQLWAGGGSGGRGTNAAAAAGAGGGAYNSMWIPLSLLSATEAVTIGAGGAAKNTNAFGDDGGNSDFDGMLFAFGGAGGTVSTGSSGGGQSSAGKNGLSAIPSDITALLLRQTVTNGAGDGGLPFGGMGATSALNAGSSSDGGGGGGLSLNTLKSLGGSSINGGGGGGGSGNATIVGGAGGSSINGGGGGGGGALDSSPGAGAGGTSQTGGAGGAGAFDANNATAGTAPGGAGGGSETGDSGAGADGQCVVIVI